MKEPIVLADAPKDIQENLKKYPKLLQKLLFSRGIKTEKEAEEFLNPDWDRDIHDPFLILNMQKSVDRIFDAMKKNEKIIIYGDYDCDGIPGSTILHDFFKKIKYENVGVYIPHRHKEGYGLNHEAIEGFAKDDVSLMITIDCGIADIKEVANAQKLGVDVIVTDHHLPQDTLPKAYAILNSKQKNDTYPDDMLCGAGVAFKLVQALLIEGRKKNKFSDIPVGWEKWLLDMAGLSTVADMVPLLKENRTLAYFGLKVMRKSKRPGLVALLKKIKVNQNYLTEGDIAFMIAPRINAASRMDVPIEAFRLLATDNMHEAVKLAEHLQEINDKRKGIVASMVREAKKKLKDREIREVLVIGNPLWRPGVLGLLATRLVEDYGKPAFVWGREGSENIKGSCRSDGSLNVVDLMTAVKEDFFLDVGGHSASGGFSISQDNIHQLEEELNKAHKKIEKTENGRDQVLVDAELILDDINWDLYNTISKMEPFGMGNPNPKFLLKSISISEIKHFGKDKNHLELFFKNSTGGKISAIGFFSTHDSFDGDDLEEGSQIDLVATVEKSMFRGRKELRLRIEDVFTRE